MMCGWIRLEGAQDAKCGFDGSEHTKPKAMLKLTEPNVVEINKDLYLGTLTSISAINGGL
jgi:hypothetical protein